MTAPAGPRLLIYHKVGVDLGQQMEVTVEDFEWQLAHLEAKYQVVSLTDALARWNEPGSEDLVVLTFDDGYIDTFSAAYPRMSDRGMPFTLYVATEQVENSSSGEEERTSLNWDEISNMLTTGLMTLGAHTHTHRDLRGCSLDEIQDELSRSDELIELRAGVKPEHFAYPWGYWSKRAEEVVAERYRSAVLGAPFRASYEFDPFLIHRYPVQLSDGRRFFEARLRGGMLLEERIRRRLRGYEGP